MIARLDIRSYIALEGHIKLVNRGKPMVNPMPWLPSHSQTMTGSVILHWGWKKI